MWTMTDPLLDDRSLIPGNFLGKETERTRQGENLGPHEQLDPEWQLGICVSLAHAPGRNH